jgi:hypothetical protein
MLEKTQIDQSKTDIKLNITDQIKIKPFCAINSNYSVANPTKKVNLLATKTKHPKSWIQVQT